MSAQILARLAKRSGYPDITTLLKTLSADEGRHAAHGWDVVEYCLREGGEFVASALAGAVRSLPTEFAVPIPQEAEDGSLEVFGMPGRALVAEEYAKACTRIRTRIANHI